MTDGTTIVRQRQLAIRREMDRRGIAMKVVAADSGIPASTLASYFPADPYAEPHLISGAAIYALCNALPADLLSFLLPDGFLMVRAPSGIDHDAIDRACRDYSDTKAAAHDPASEAGRDLGPNELRQLGGKVVELRARAA